MNAKKRRGTACHNSCHKNKRIGRKYPMWTIRLWRSFFPDYTREKKPTFAGFSNCRQKGAVSKWLKQAMRGSTFFRNIFGQSKTECRKNGTQGIIFIRNSKCILLGQARRWRFDSRPAGCVRIRYPSRPAELPFPHPVPSCWSAAE